MFGLVADGLGVLFQPRAEKSVNLLFDNANNGYNEVRTRFERMNPRLQGAILDPGTFVRIPACYHHQRPMGTDVLIGVRAGVGVRELGGSVWHTVCVLLFPAVGFY